MISFWKLKNIKANCERQNYIEWLKIENILKIKDWIKDIKNWKYIKDKRGIYMVELKIYKS